MADTLDRQDQIRRDLVADVAHELRTPIAVLQAGHEALLDGVTEPTPAELSSLRDEVLRLARMVDDLQTLAAADAAALHLARQPGDLADLAAARPAAWPAGSRLPTSPWHRQLAPAPVLGDSRWLHQIDHQPADQRAEVHPARRQRHHRHQAQAADAVLGSPTPASASPPRSCRISSTGSGAAGAAQISGSGIGLSIAAELARAHGGTLTAGSQPGHGTRLTLTLPLAGKPQPVE